MIGSTFEALLHYRSLFSQARSFSCFCLLVFTTMARLQSSCISGLISEFGLAGCHYHRFLRLFEALARDPEALERIHVEQTLKNFASGPKHFLLLDSTIVPKEGRRMPGVSSLRQTSSSNSKKEFIMGHDVENIALLVGKGSESFAVPLISFIRNGAVHSNRKSLTCLDRICTKLARYECLRGSTLVGDCYYSSGPLARVLKDELSISILTRVKSNAVGYRLPQPAKEGSRGRPRKYGEKVTLKSLGRTRKVTSSFSITSNGVTNRYSCWEDNLHWKGYKKPIRFIRVQRNGQQEIVLMTNDESLSVEEIVGLYVCRWRIEEMFKEQKSQMDFGRYRFWTKACPRSRKGKKVHTHRMNLKDKQAIILKEAQYQAHLNLTNISSAQLHRIRHQHTQNVWESFPGWLRSLRPGITPSMRVCKEAFKYELLQYLGRSEKEKSLQKSLKFRPRLHKSNAIEQARNKAA